MKTCKYKNILRYLIMTFLLPLICAVAEKTIKNEILIFCLYGLQAASPSLAAIIEIKIFEKQKLSAYFKFKIEFTAVIIPVLTACFTMLISRAIYIRISDSNVILSELSVKRWIIVLWAIFAEEIGWRGFLELSLRKIFKKPILATLITGCVWSCWHYHYFIFNGMEIPILLFMTGAVIESFIYSYLMIFTKQNILSAMMYHFSWNLFLHLFLINPSYNDGSLVPYIEVIAFEIITAACMALYRKIKFSN